MEYLIRPLDITDYKEMTRLWQISGLPYRANGRDSSEAMAVEFKRMETCFLGMFDGDKMIGTIIGSSDGRKGWINRLAIDPDYRGQKLASRLIKECEDFLHDLGLEVIACLIEDVNTPSLSAFEKSGYKISDEILYCSKRESEEA
ncbi:MAG: GNAT family N-acetyltransferase [candidate division Zixibacteria bacterium]|nr:GNAT family N-acetyltransferase [candidate division Zixibacteria bacterium]